MWLNVIRYATGIRPTSWTLLQTTNFSQNNHNNRDNVVGVSGSQFNRLTQSKSSGSIPDNLSNLNKPRVRFDILDKNDNEDKNTSTVNNTEMRLSNLNMNCK